MLQRTLCRFSAGGGDLFPTSKKAAHLVPAWVLQRRVSPPPGAGRCHVGVTQPAVRSKWQLTRPEVHSVAVANIDAATSPPGATTPRPSKKAVSLTLAGVRGSLNHNSTSSDNSIAMANIAEKEQSEALMKTRDYTKHKTPIKLRSGWETTTDVVELSEWMYARINNHRKLCNDNAKGFEKEFMVWETKPVPPAVKK